MCQTTGLKTKNTNVVSLNNLYRLFILTITNRYVKNVPSGQILPLNQAIFSYLVGNLFPNSRHVLNCRIQLGNIVGNIVLRRGVRRPRA